MRAHDHTDAISVFANRCFRAIITILILLCGSYIKYVHTKANLTSYTQDVCIIVG